MGYRSISKEPVRHRYAGQHNDTYGVSTMCNHPILTTEEENELARKIKNGDEAAYQRLVECNVRLVASLAKSHIKKIRYGFSDAVNNGILGLMIAARRFDPEKGVRFSSYATWWIKRAIRDGQRDTISAAVAVPKQAIYLHYQQLNGKQLNPRNKKTALLASKAIGYGVAGTIADLEDEAPYHDTPPYPEELLILLRECLPKLSEKDRTLLTMRYGLPPYESPISLREVAKIEGRTVKAIHEREKRARMRLQALMVNHREVFHSNPPS